MRHLRVRVCSLYKLRTSLIMCAIAPTTATTILCLSASSYLLAMFFMLPCIRVAVSTEASVHPFPGA